VASAPGKQHLLRSAIDGDAHEATAAMKEIALAAKSLDGLVGDGAFILPSRRADVAQVRGVLGVLRDDDGERARGTAAENGDHGASWRKPRRSR
jgi:hypothetical protein